MTNTTTTETDRVTDPNFLSIPDPYGVAELLGREAGRNLASWVCDGNGATDSYQRTLDGIRDGDPEILDMLPTVDLSGEWADTPTGCDIMSDVADMFDIECYDDFVQDVLFGCVDAYALAADAAVADEVERHCLAMLGES